MAQHGALETLKDLAEKEVDDAARRLFFSTAKRPALTGRFVIGLRPARAFPCLARAHSHGMPPALRQNHHTSDTLPFRWNNR